MPRAWIGLGSNVGDRLGYIESAVLALARLPETSLIAASSVYDTAPVGDQDQPRFLNAVALIDSNLDPHCLLAHLQATEQAHGRVRRERWGPRTLDLDLLLCDDVEVETDALTVPHPRLTERAFVLVPLAEISPDAAIPGCDMGIAELLEALGSSVCEIRRVCGPPVGSQ